MLLTHCGQGQEWITNAFRVYDMNAFIDWIKFWPEADYFTPIGADDNVVVVAPAGWMIEQQREHYDDAFFLPLPTHVQEYDRTTGEPLYEHPLYWARTKQHDAFEVGTKDEILDDLEGTYYQDTDLVPCMELPDSAGDMADIMIFIHELSNHVDDNETCVLSCVTADYGELNACAYYLVGGDGSPESRTGRVDLREAYDRAAQMDGGKLLLGSWDPAEEEFAHAAE